MNKEIYESYNILKKVYFDGGYAGVELNKLLIKAENINTKMITKLVYGVIEKDIFLSYVVDNFVTKKAKDTVLLMLKMGAYMHYFMNSIPPYTIVNECVNLIKKEEDKYIGGFVNATLKNIISTKIKLPSKESDFVKYLSVVYSYPEWLIELFIKEKGKDFTKELLSTKITELTHIRVNTKKISVNEFVKLLDKYKINYEKSLYDYTFNVDYSKLLSIKEMTKFYVVQGLPSIIACNLLEVEKSSKVLDCCSAPGGKSMYLASIDESVDVTACDIYPFKVSMIKEFSTKLGLKNVKPLLNDGTKYNSDFENKFDFIMCDVPCSNTGVISKKPDVLLKKNKQDVFDLSEIQYSILSTNAKYLKSGGKMIYSTCSIMAEENEKILERFLENNKDFKYLPFSIDGMIDEKVPYYTFYPNVTKTEGFFIGRLIKL